MHLLQHGAERARFVAHCAIRGVYATLRRGLCHISKGVEPC